MDKEIIRNSKSDGIIGDGFSVGRFGIGATLKSHKEPIDQRGRSCLASSSSSSSGATTIKK